MYLSSIFHICLSNNSIFREKAGIILVLSDNIGNPRQAVMHSPTVRSPLEESCYCLEHLHEGQSLCSSVEEQDVLLSQNLQSKVRLKAVKELNCKQIKKAVCV